MEDKNTNYGSDARPYGEQQTESQPGAGQAAGQPGATGQQPGQELLDELTQLADKFATVVRTAWNSEQRKQIETDVKSGLSTMATSIEEGFKQVASSTEAKDLQTKATEVGEKVSSSKFFADLTGALTVGLRGLSDQLDKVSKDLQAKSAATGAPGASGAAAGSEPKSKDDAQDIPISRE